jgi:tripartite ATP-independent transporter DctM subunit
MSPELLGGLMLALMIFVIFVGFPIAFTLLLLALVFGYLGLGDMVFYLMVFQTIGLMKEEVLAAVPLFIFMGYITEQAGLMERLFRVLQLMMAPLRGSLYVAVILTATVFAMATGIVGAAVTVLGIMAAPIMIKSGYSPSLSAGAIAAGGTLGILIPPSVMIIVMAPVLGVSVVKLYAAAFGPGFLLAGLYIVYTLGRSYLNPRLGPAVPLGERATSVAELGRAFVVGVVPLALLIGCTLGSILAGLATPTEAASVGASGAMILGFAYGRLTLSGIRQAAISTLTTSSMVLFLAVTSNVFGAVFARLGTATVVTNALLALPVPPFVMLLIVMALIFLLGWPFEWPAIVLVFLPILYPVIAALKYDPIWFGALIAVNLQTAFLSPPVAMSAYYLRSVVPQWDLSTIYRGMMNFMVIQVICLILVLLFPQIALWFPNYLFGK